MQEYDVLHSRAHDQPLRARHSLQPAGQLDGKSRFFMSLFSN